MHVLQRFPRGHVADFHGNGVVWRDGRQGNAAAVVAAATIATTGSRGGLSVATLTTPITPTPSTTTASAAPATSFVVVQAISFTAPFAMTAAAETEAPFANAPTQTCAANPGGAATACSAIFAPTTAGETEIPRRPKAFRNFSTARATRFFAASSDIPNAAPISAIG